jgi:hypothetical protein
LIVFINSIANGYDLAPFLAGFRLPQGVFAALQNLHFGQFQVEFFSQKRTVLIASAKPASSRREFWQ